MRRDTQDRAPGARPPGTVGGVVAKFALAGFAAVALVGVAAFFLMRHIGTTEATDNAKQVTRVVGRGVVDPALTPAVMRGDPAALRRLDRLVRKRVLDDSIVRVKIWTPNGRIVYSDEPRLIGQRYALAPDDAAVLSQGGVESSLSDLSAPENRYEDDFGKLLQVYMPIHSPTGGPLLFETYQRFSSVASSGTDIWLAFAPALIGALILLELVHVPLASSMAKRLRRGHAEREALLQRAIDSSEIERRRIASDLHDGAVQRLAGTSFSLDAAAERYAANDPDASKTLRAGAGETRQSVRELRSLLTEIYPASLRDAGLEEALTDLLAPLEGRGMKTTLEVDAGVEPAPEFAALFFRTAQEAVRNAVKHGDADTVRVTVGRENGHASLEVSDDGTGFDPEKLEAPGHFGMRILSDLARDAGATLNVDSAPGRGTTVRVEVNA